MQATTSPYITVKKSGIHSTGVFAATNIVKGTRVIEYVGDIITKKEADRRCDVHIDNHKKDRNHGAVYIYELDKKHDIDGSVSWNTAKFINHSCEPNCEADFVRGHIWITAIRHIKKGEELSYDYGYDLEDFHDHPCQCGAQSCCGYIVSEEDRAKLRKILAKRHAI